MALFDLSVLWGDLSKLFAKKVIAMVCEKKSFFFYLLKYRFLIISLCV